MADTIERKRLIFPGLAGIYELAAPHSYAFMRFATGAVLVPHGVQKIVNNSAEGLAKVIAGHGLPASLALAWLAIFAESAAAICLAIGLFNPPCGARHLDRDVGDHLGVPVGVRLFLDQSRSRIRLPLVAPLSGDLLQGRRGTLARLEARPGVLRR
jgi:hypothetical protein